MSNINGNAGNVIADVRAGKVSTSDWLIIILLFIVLVVSTIFFVILVGKKKTDGQVADDYKIAQKDSLIFQKDQLIISLQQSNSDKDKRIIGIMQKDSLLQQIAVNNNFLLRKLNAKDVQITNRINSPSFTTDSLSEYIKTHY